MNHSRSLLARSLLTVASGAVLLPFLLAGPALAADSPAIPNQTLASGSVRYEYTYAGVKPDDGSMTITCDDGETAIAGGARFAEPGWGVQGGPTPDGTGWQVTPVKLDQNAAPSAAGDVVAELYAICVP